MPVVIVLEGVGADRFTVAVSPPAELAASLHVLTGGSHHAERAGWAAGVLRAAPPDFHTGLTRFAPLWTALRWRCFYPGVDETPDGPGLDRFAELTAFACASGYSGFGFDRVLHDPAQAAVLRQTAERLPDPHLRLAEDLLRDPAALRHDIARFTALCHRVYFARLWADVEPALSRAAHRVRRSLADAGPAAALMSLSPSSARLTMGPSGPARVVFDKVHHAVISPARSPSPVVLVPTVFGSPHLLAKTEPGAPPVLHFPVPGPPRSAVSSPDAGAESDVVVGVTLARGRLLALTDARRVRLCRLIARQAMTTADLADRLGMTRPQVSRHLRVLRDLDLVQVERHGRHVHYALDLAAVRRLGQDVATALQY
jgi:DNA-binding transcriptional ArsR family regulator